MRINTKKIACLTALMIIGLFLISPLAVAMEPQKININSATKEQLMTLKGVGEKVAERVIAYRKDVGPFKIPEEIMKVKGIGPKTFKNNQDRIIVKLPKMSMK
jgi:competence protein ComEA